MKTQTAIPLLTVICIALAAGCAKTKAPVPVDDAATETPFVLADNPNAKISDVLQRMRGRWIKELKDPNTPDPIMMRLFATADNTLTGRMLFAGAFADVGVSAQLVQSGDQFTLILTDDDQRPHSGIPESRTLVGTYDAPTATLELKGKDSGEWMKFVMAGGYSIVFSGSVYQCYVPRTPTGPVGPANPPTTPSTPTGPTAAPPVVVDHAHGPSGTPDGDGHHGHHHHIFAAGEFDRVAELMADPTPTPAPTPSPTPTIVIKAAVCGMQNSFEDEWSRMSGAGG